MFKRNFALEMQEQEITVDAAVQLMEQEHKDETVIEDAAYIDIKGEDVLEPIDTIVEETNTIRNISNAVPDEQPISSIAAEMLHLTLKRSYERLGIEARFDLPSLEDFSDKHKGTACVRLSKESIAETLKMVMQKIYEFFKKVWEKLSKYVSIFMDKAEAERAARAQTVLDAQAKKMKKDATPFDINNESILKAFFIEEVKDAPSAESIKTLIENTMNFANFTDMVGGEFTALILQVELNIRSAIRHIDESVLGADQEALDHIKESDDIFGMEWTNKILSLLKTHSIINSNNPATFELRNTHKDAEISFSLVSNMRYVFFTNELNGHEVFTAQLVEDKNIAKKISAKTMQSPTVAETVELIKLNGKLTDLVAKVCTGTSSHDHHITRIDRMLGSINELKHQIARVSTTNPNYNQVADKVNDLYAVLSQFFRTYNEFIVKGLKIIKDTNTVTTGFLSNLTTAYKDNDKK